MELPQITPPEAAERTVEVESAPTPRRIVIVEDSRDSREMLRYMLEHAGHEVHAAGDGPQGVDAALRLEPDVALIDVGLPQLDGYEVAKRIRADASADMLLVALTGYGLAEDRERAIAAGFDLHLVKPIDFDRLFDILATAPRPAGRDRGH